MNQIINTTGLDYIHCTDIAPVDYVKVVDIYGVNPKNVSSHIRAIDFKNKKVLWLMRDQFGNALLNKTKDELIEQWYDFQHIEVIKNKQIIIKW